MSAGDLVAILLGVVTLVLAAVTTAMLLWLTSLVRRLRQALAEVRDELLPAMDELHEAALDARAEVERIDRVLDRSELVAERVDTASKVAYSALSRPVIRAMAVKEGTAEAVRKIRGR